MNNTITPKQQRFIDEYLISLNATQAAIKAGYSVNSAKVQGHRMLTNDNVQEIISQATKKRSEKVEVTKEYVLTNLKSIVERCLQAKPAVDKEGNETGVYKFNPAAANKALELLFTDVYG